MRTTLLFTLPLLLLACGDDSSPGIGPGGSLCSNTCDFPGDGECDDGGEGAITSFCAFGTDCIDCGPRGGGGGAMDAGGGGGGGGCRCQGAVNGDSYDIACGEERCVDGQERRCEDRRLVGLGTSCGSSSCTALTESGCSGGPSCCSVSGGGVATCFNNTCCRTTGEAQATNECCLNSVESGGKICCFVDSSNPPTDC
ncbi:MAG: hypothetical protein AAF411_25855 [Myxococcota bacterium]